MCGCALQAAWKIARRLAAGQAAGAPDSPIAVRLPNGKKGNIASRSSVGYLCGEVARKNNRCAVGGWILRLLIYAAPAKFEVCCFCARSGTAESEKDGLMTPSITRIAKHSAAPSYFRLVF